MMGDLMQHLEDASRSGVYRLAREDEITTAVPQRRISVARIGYGEKSLLMKNIAAALRFPAWFGANWDALEDCLSDLSWLQAAGHVLVFDNAKAGDEFGVLVDVLGSVAEYWRARGTPFFAFFIDPAGVLPLPELAGAP